MLQLREIGNELRTPLSTLGRWADEYNRYLQIKTSLLEGTHLSILNLLETMIPM